MNRTLGVLPFQAWLGSVGLALATGCSGPSNAAGSGAAASGNSAGMATGAAGAGAMTSGAGTVAGSSGGTTGASASGSPAQSGSGGMTGAAAGTNGSAGATAIDPSMAPPIVDGGARDAARSTDAGPRRADAGMDATPDMATPTPTDGGAVPLNPALLPNCTGTSPIVCTINVPNGNYDVTAELGSASASATTRVLSELLRIDLQPTSTGAGTFFQDTFTVNVRAEVHKTYTAPGGVLNLLFDGLAPALHGLGVAPAPNAITVFLAGDSTVCDWDPTASDAITPPTPSIERGWGQELSQFFVPGPAVADYAVSGETAGGFYTAYFPQARTAMKAGDYLFVQFGHNDQKSAADIANYQANLTRYITDARAKNVTPVIVTPVARGTGTDFLGLDQQARDLATAQGVTLIDLTNLAWAYYQTLPNKSVLFVPGQSTHFTESGATQIAKIVAEAIRTSGLGLATFLK